MNLKWRPSLFIPLSLLCVVLLLCKTPRIVEAETPVKGKVYIVALKNPPPVAAYGGERVKVKPSLLGASSLLTVSKNEYTSFKDKITYAAYLGKLHVHLLLGASVPLQNLIYSLRYGLNGFCAKLTDGQAAALKASPDVLSITPSVPLSLGVADTPLFLNMSTTLWPATTVAGVSGSGENVIVGIIDTGVWPEHASFSDKVTPTYGPVPAKWKGSCSFTNFTCNRKLIGGAYFYQSFLAASGNITFVDDYQSPRDSLGHGSHVSGTAVGNSNVPIVINGQSFGSSSGMAPRARLAIYKVFWRSTNVAYDQLADAGDVTAAIDRAIQDGVSLISASLGGLSDFFSPIDMMYLTAVKAGIFVSQAASNTGPAANTVTNVAPWTTTVAACHHERLYQVKLTYGSYYPYYQCFSGDPTNTKRTLIDGTRAALNSSVAAKAANCTAGSLNATLVAGKNVLCVRDSESPFTKCNNLKSLGAKGMILMNPSAAVNDAVLSPAFSLPTVSIAYSEGANILKYIAKNPAAAYVTISALQSRVAVEAPLVASFSSRGPVEPLSPSDSNQLSGNRNNILKPDICAPGVYIVDAFPSVGPGVVIPTAWGTSNFWILSGTSMATPHISGIAALVKQVYPTWSPYAIKSALMTTAMLTDNVNVTIKVSDGSVLRTANPFDVGAGHVYTTRLLDPGLVFNETYENSMAFLSNSAFNGSDEYQALNLSSYPNQIPSYGLNLPFISVSMLSPTASSVKVKRVVTNVANVSATYNATVVAPANVTVTVNPNTFTIDVGQSVTYYVNVTRIAANIDYNFAFGSLTWSDGVHSVRTVLATQTI